MTREARDFFAVLREQWGSIMTKKATTKRVGGITEYVRNGKLQYRSSTIDPDKKKKLVSTMKQGMSRWRMGNVNNLWSAFKYYGCQPRFQSKSPGRTDYDEFKSYAMHATAIYLTKEESKEAKASVLVPVTIAVGSLPSIEVGCDAVGVISDISVGSLTLTDETTVGLLSQAIMHNNQGFRRGDILTFIVGFQHIDGAGIPRAQFRHHDLTLEPSNSQPLASLPGSQEAFAIRDGRLASTVNSGAAAWVHCRPGSPTKANDPDQYSTQTLWCANQELIDRYNSEEAILRAGQSYNGPKQESFLTPEPTPDDLAGRN